MNICESRHEPKYQVIYKPAKPKYHTRLKSVTGSNYTPVWLVCENCMKNRRCFGSEDQIETVEILVVVGQNG